jgi:hypothetical protein
MDGELSRQVTWYESLTNKVDQASNAVEKLAMWSVGRKFDGPFVLSEAQFHQTMSEIEATDGSVGQLADSVKKLNALKIQIMGGHGTEMKEQVNTIEEGIARIAVLQQKAGVDQQATIQAVKKAEEELTAKKSEANAKVGKEIMENQKKTEKANEALAKIASERADWEIKEFRKATMAELEDKEKAVQEEYRMKEEAFRLNQSMIEGTLRSKMTEAKGPDDQIAALSAAMKASDDLVAVTEEELQRKLELHQKYADKIQEIQNKKVQDERDSVEKMTSYFQKGIMSWMKGTESFGRAMEQAWLGMAGAAVQSIMRIAAQEVIGMMLHKEIAMKGVVADAHKAAAGAYSAMVGIPVIGPIIAPIAAAGSFAAVAAFESFDQGGIASGGLSVVHAREMVLPANLSDFVQKAAANSSGDAEGKGHTFNYSPNVNAIDRNGMQDALKEHGEFMFTMWRQQMRNRSI